MRGSKEWSQDIMLTATILRSIWPVARDLATQLGVTRRAACYQISALHTTQATPVYILHIYEGF